VVEHPAEATVAGILDVRKADVRVSLAQPWVLTPSSAAGRSPQPIRSASSTMIPSGPRI
jgi:hypothetical protein